MVGGPNGAGKTTWAVERLPLALEIQEFVNADEIARGLSPLDPDRSAATIYRGMSSSADMLRDFEICTISIFHLQI